MYFRIYLNGIPVGRRVQGPDAETVWKRWAPRYPDHEVTVRNSPPTTVYVEGRDHRTGRYVTEWDSEAKAMLDGR